MRVLSAILLAGIIGGCASPQMAWIRIAGVRGNGDPLLTQQFELDKTTCLGEMQRRNSSGGTLGAGAAADRSVTFSEVARACMAEKGYVLVREDEADAKAAELRATSAEKKRREEPALAPPPAAPPKRR